MPRHCAAGVGRLRAIALSVVRYKKVRLFAVHSVCFLLSESSSFAIITDINGIHLLRGHAAGAGHLRTHRPLRRSLHEVTPVRCTKVRLFAVRRITRLCAVRSGHVAGMWRNWAHCHYVRYCPTQQHNPTSHCRHANEFDGASAALEDLAVQRFVT
jgi:hypothetical protein